MKKYPRIYSLSTAGIIHHQENDYLFHSARTDFIGDSASGKSIIADLLQLIFVGSTAFKSATATIKEKRDPDGLVLTTPGRGANIAYAFLNIETADEQFIVIGAYFESISKHTKPFIIQASTEIENEKLTPMLVPLKAADFKNRDELYDLEELAEAMEDRQLILKKWEKINPYHRILYNNDILPLDLAANDKTLNDYAKIIQSFSRAKTLDTQKSKSLLDFLFGQEKGKELCNKYLQIVKELDNATSSYGQNLESIALLINKYNSVCDLKKLLDIKNVKKKEYLNLELIYLREEYEHISNSISSNTEKILTASYGLNQLIAAAQKDIDHAQKIKIKIDESVNEALVCYSNARQAFNILKEAQTLLTDLNIEEQYLESIYQDYCKKKERYTLLQDFKAKLLEKNLQAFFEQSEWAKEIQAGNEYFGKRINEIKSNLEYLKLLSEYTDINNPDSLVRWAISLNRPLTKIEESLVLHFQTLKRIEPENPTQGNRYLPLPEVLLDNKIEEKDSGFWIDLGGIREYVDYVSEQRLNTTDKETINKYFESQNQNIEQQKELLENEYKNLQALNTILSELNNAAGSIEIYRKRADLKDFREIELLNINEDQFQSYQSCLKRKKIVEQEYNDTQQKYDEIKTKQIENEAIFKKLPDKIATAKEWIQKVEIHKTLLDDIRQQFSVNQSYDYDLIFYQDAEDKVDKFQTEFGFLKEDLKLIEKIQKEKISFDQQKAELHQKEKSFQFYYNESPQNKLDTVTSQLIQEKRQESVEADAAYNAEFKLIVKNFIPNESYKFEGENNDFADLVTHLLPDIFKDEKAIETEAIGKIERHLKQINDKNRDLNAKKTRKIGDLLDEVQTAIGAQADIIRKINRFFNNGEKRISGNYKLNLTHTETKGFPVDWLSDFKNINDERLNLSEISISIEEKIKEAFRELTGNRNPDISIEDLLNPNSYMELSLDMEDPNGKTNKGSTGQTYAAIALFCIARLSIVGNKREEKEHAIRFMPIDEAEGLGSNFEMLNEIAQDKDYQIITFAINPLGRYNEQFIYVLHRNPDVDANINYTPMAIYSKSDIKDDLKELIEI